MKTKKSKRIIKEQSQGTDVKEKGAKSAVESRYVAQRNIERFKKCGWKVIKENEYKIGGVRVHQNDLVLMEKE